MLKSILLEQEYKPTGAKIFLATIQEYSHIQHLIKLAQDSRLIDLLGWNTFFEIHEIEKFIAAISSHALPYCRDSEPLVFGIYLTLDDFPIGYVVLKGMNVDLLAAEVGVVILDSRYRNKGYGRLGLQRIVNYAFNELQLKTIGSSILLSNKTSINMCKKTGFIIKETMYKSWTMPNGDLADMVLMELSKVT
ncbi:GNAT family N-acetyltransferase [Okeanomitos corallinicola TIOX110]|uniref:GNAT family N-acetyltransferase n=1 Tax=Okeanomitos corallinicola TIOX110 TaxID=3133117 RepID=A0ABZ2UWG3_9CYAN